MQKPQFIRPNARDVSRTMLAILVAYASFCNGASGAEPGDQPAGPTADREVLYSQFDRFLTERERRAEAQAQAVKSFERFLAHNPDLLNRIGSPTTPQSSRRAGGQGTVAKSAGAVERSGSSTPVTAGRATSSPTEGPGTASNTLEVRLHDSGRVDVSSLEGDWCSGLVVYRGLPPLRWDFVGPRRMRITFPVLAGASRGEMRTQEQGIEALPDGRVRLIDDRANVYSETVYAVEPSALQGISYRHMDKRSGVEKTTTPDSFRRCASGE